MKRKFIHGNQDLVILLCDDEDVEKITSGLSCSVLAISDFDWNRDLSPWPAPAVFKGDDFAGKADETIEKIKMDPALSLKWSHIYICGYSMAGLFALYMAGKVHFSGIASCSGSLWFEGFLDWLQVHPLSANKIYLSVGDREDHSRNERMKRVIENTREAAQILTKNHVVKFELNPGNHFNDPEERMRRGLLWLLKDQ